MLHQLWNRFANTGLSKEIEEREFIKVRVLNQLTLMTFINAGALFIVTMLIT